MWAPWKSVHLQSNQIHSTNMYVLGQFFFFYFIWVCTVERWQEMKGERLVVTCNRDCNEDIGVCSQRLNPSNPPGAPIKKCIVFTFFLLEWRYKSWVFKFEVVVFFISKTADQYCPLSKKNGGLLIWTTEPWLPLKWNHYIDAFPPK